jgi:DUF2075 family protein
VQPVTEFQVQGLEVDLPIVMWGEDLLWSGTGWDFKPKRRRAHVEAPEQLLENVYRVLLTRGRDGLIIVVPDDAAFDSTELALLASGVRPLPEADRTMLMTAAEDRPASNGH